MFYAFELYYEINGTRSRQGLIKFTRIARLAIGAVHLHRHLASGEPYCPFCWCFSLQTINSKLLKHYHVPQDEILPLSAYLCLGKHWLAKQI